MQQTGVAVAPCSLMEAARREADRHKWLRSEQEKRDVGVVALREWFHKYWFSFCRWRRIEHVCGERFWVEFGEQTFGSLCPLIRQHDPLVEAILDRVARGHENLDIICWALRTNQPMDKVRYILEQLDINSARLEPSFRDFS